MRVRHFSTFISQQKLFQTAQLKQLQKLRLGLEATYWLRSLHELKEPYVEALGGVSDQMINALHTQVDKFIANDISPVFVFPGIQPKTHMLWATTRNTIDQAWNHWFKGNEEQAREKFLIGTSRVSSDLCARFLHELIDYKNTKYAAVEDGPAIFQASYLAPPQMAHMVECEVLDAVFGPPSLLLFGIPRVITTIDFEKKKFEWIDRATLMKAWDINEDQLLDACLLAGTEYSLTFPFLDLRPFHRASNFTFDMAVEFIRQSPLSAYIESFPSVELKQDHVYEYYQCRALIRYPLVLTKNGTVDLVKPPKLADYGGSSKKRANDTEEEKLSAPRDFHKVFGARPSQALFQLLMRGLLSKKVLTAFALGEWTDTSDPVVDSLEYHEMLLDMIDHRRRILGLLTMRSSTVYSNVEVPFCKIQCYHTGPADGHEPPSSGYFAREKVLSDKGLPWYFTVHDLKEELARQGCGQKMSLRFCLRWHTNLALKEEDGSPLKSLLTHETNFQGPVPPSFADDCGAPKEEQFLLLYATVTFMLLENFGYFTKTGDITTFGHALSAVPEEFTKDAMVCIEMLRLGLLSGDKFHPPSSRAYPENVRWIQNGPNDGQHVNAVLLLSRVMSMQPLELREGHAWNSGIDFDLAAFHVFLKMIKRTANQMMEACMANVLLQDIGFIKELPPNIMTLDDALPVFRMRRNMLGIVAKYFLEMDFGSRKVDLSSELERAFPSVQQPVKHLLRAFAYWMTIRQLVVQISKRCSNTETLDEVQAATRLLKSKVQQSGIMEHPDAQGSPYIKAIQQLNEVEDIC